jgi:hypothetical protein
MDLCFPLENRKGNSPEYVPVGEIGSLVETLGWERLVFG